MGTEGLLENSRHSTGNLTSSKDKRSDTSSSLAITFVGSIIALVVFLGFLHLYYKEVKHFNLQVKEVRRLKNISRNNHILSKEREGLQRPTLVSWESLTRKQFSLYFILWTSCLLLHSSFFCLWVKSCLSFPASAKVFGSDSCHHNSFSTFSSWRNLSFYWLSRWQIPCYDSAQTPINLRHQHFFSCPLCVGHVSLSVCCSTSSLIPSDSEMGILSLVSLLEWLPVSSFSQQKPFVVSPENECLRVKSFRSHFFQYFGFLFRESPKFWGKSTVCLQEKLPTNSWLLFYLCLCLWNRYQHCQYHCLDEVRIVSF